MSNQGVSREAQAGGPEDANPAQLNNSAFFISQVNLRFPGAKGSVLDRSGLFGLVAIGRDKAPDCLVRGYRLGLVLHEATRPRN